MNINLVKLVSESNFKKYRFVVSGCKDVKLEARINYGSNSGVGILNVHFDKPMEENNLCYDIAENWDCFADRADSIAYCIEKSKLFKFDYLECDFNTQTLFVHFVLA